jgi:hypothetical protein
MLSPGAPEWRRVTTKVGSIRDCPLGQPFYDHHDRPSFQRFQTPEIRAHPDQPAEPRPD